MRKNPLIAFILGLFSFGVPYAMAGIAGAVPDDDLPPLNVYWSRKYVKWIVAAALLCEVWYLGAVLVQGGRHNPAVWLGLPFVLVAVFGIAEILYELFSKTDGFMVTQAHAFGRTECLSLLKGPAKVVSDLIAGLPERARPGFALAWAFLLGAVYSATFYASIAVAFVVGYCFLAVALLFFVLGFFAKTDDGGGGGGRVRRDVVPDYPPVPLEGYGLLDERGQVFIYRRRGTVFMGKRKVGYHDGGTVKVYTLYNRVPTPVYELAGNQIIDLETGGLYGTFDTEGVYDGQGNLRFRLLELPV